MGQAGEVDHRQQAIFAQRPLANSGPSVVRCLQAKWLDRHFRGHCSEWVANLSLAPPVLTSSFLQT